MQYTKATRSEVIDAGYFCSSVLAFFITFRLSSRRSYWTCSDWTRNSMLKILFFMSANFWFHLLPSCRHVSWQILPPNVCSYCTQLSRRNNWGSCFYQNSCRVLGYFEPLEKFNTQTGREFSSSSFGLQYYYNELLVVCTLKHRQQQRIQGKKLKPRWTFLISTFAKHRHPNEQSTYSALVQCINLPLLRLFSASSSSWFNSLFFRFLFRNFGSFSCKIVFIAS